MPVRLHGRELLSHGFTVDQVVRDAERAARLDIPCIALFPYTEPSLRDEQGSEALNPDNLVCQSVRAIKEEFPDIGEFKLAPAAFEQKLADGIFKPGNMLRQRWLGLVQQLCRVSHRSRMGDRKEDPKLVKREWGRGHQTAHQTVPGGP